MTRAEWVDILKRATVLDLVQMLACKAAAGIARGDGSQSYQAEARTEGGPTAVVRVRITKKREPKRTGFRSPTESRKGSAE